MAQDSDKHHQWSAEPIKVSSDNPCGATRRQWPHRDCNIEKGHKGDHCNIKQSGSNIVTLVRKEGE